MSKSNIAKKGIFPSDISKKQSSDTGMAMVLILLLLGFFTENILYYKIALPVLLINMTAPNVFYYLAFIWLGLSNTLGFIFSNILLTVIYFIIVLPVSMIRRIMRKDTLLLKEFKKKTNSVLKIRDYTFSSIDFEKPF